MKGQPPELILFEGRPVEEMTKEELLKVITRMALDLEKAKEELRRKHRIIFELTPPWR